MKLLRDVVRRRNSDWSDSWGGTCSECDWSYSGEVARAGLIRHFEGCSMFNEDGIEE